MPPNARWLGLVAGVLGLVLGFWASQQRFPACGALLLIWVGFFALLRGISEMFRGISEMFRGISETVMALELKSA